jgi:hypothetical protein
MNVSGSKRGTTAPSGATPERKGLRVTSLAAALSGSPPRLPSLAAASSGGLAAGPPPGFQLQVDGGANDNSVLLDMVKKQQELLERVVTLQERWSLPSVGEGMDVEDAPAAPAAPAMSTSPDKQKQLKMSSMLANKVTSLAAKLRKKLHSIMLSRDRLEKFKETVSALSSGKVPNGFKPFKLPWDGAEWSTKVEDANLSMIIVPAAKEDPLENVYEKLYIEYLASSVLLQQLAETRRLESLVSEATLEIFLIEVEAAAVAEREAFGRVAPSSCVSGMAWVSFVADIKEYGQKLYVQQVRKMALERQSDEEKKSRQAEREKKALEAAALLPESEVLRRGLKEVLNRKGFKATKYDQLPQVVEFAKLLKLDVDVVSAAALVDKSSPSAPKNGETPGAARGHNQNTKGKGKSKNDTQKGKSGKGGKSSGKNGKPQQSKGKGRGGGQQQKPKGKGKGQ